MRKIEFSKIFESGFDDFIDSCKVINLREGTIKYYISLFKCNIRI
ncbi:hypothetical protein [Clostridium perfringens]|nr:hypothetical protein [Clostridium perfringens]EDT78264.1 hypothetical protein AC7_1488 [Clostridium perfringens NCTC 8239]MDK0900688.1 hypothetical protein [Clostridium perfringens]MDT7912686.1 hypothetical protein [Clostridium perfringens]MDT7925746.1 hypothetical protein [Clostridium perfringens]MDT7958164.1 hypothetical protein [Clostridium perfringens]